MKKDEQMLNNLIKSINNDSNEQNGYFYKFVDENFWNLI